MWQQKTESIAIRGNEADWTFPVTAAADGAELPSVIEAAVGMQLRVARKNTMSDMFLVVVADKKEDTTNVLIGSGQCLLASLL